MKSINLRFAIPAAMAAALMLTAGPIFAKSNRRAVYPSAARQAQQSSAQSPNKPRSFAGNVVVQPNGTVALNAGGHNYKLSDQSKAAKFANKKVIVTGTYNPQSGTIQVKQIKPAKSVKH